MWPDWTNSKNSVRDLCLRAPLCGAIFTKDFFRAPLTDRLECCRLRHGILSWAFLWLRALTCSAAFSTRHFKIASCAVPLHCVVVPQNCTKPYKKGQSYKFNWCTGCFSKFISVLNNCNVFFNRVSNPYKKTCIYAAKFWFLLQMKHKFGSQTEGIA